MMIIKKFGSGILKKIEFYNGRVKVFCKDGSILVGRYIGSCF